MRLVFLFLALGLIYGQFITLLLVSSQLASSGMKNYVNNNVLIKIGQLLQSISASSTKLGFSFAQAAAQPQLYLAGAWMRL